MNVNNPPTRPWLVLNVMVVSGDVHDLPKHPKKLLPKFDPNKNEPPKYHMKKFTLTPRIMNTQHEDVVCKRFQYRFE